FTDLAEHRAKVRDVLSRVGAIFLGMEEYVASSASSAERTRADVRRADVYIGIFGARYGYVDTATGMSITELELREAEATNKRMLLYALHPEAPVRPRDLDPDPTSQTALRELKSRIEAQHIVRYFTDADDLAARVLEDLQSLVVARRDGASVDRVLEA